MLGRGCLCDQPPIKILGTAFLMSSLVDSILHVLSQLVAGDLTASCVTPLGEHSWKLCIISSDLCFNFALIFLP